MPSLLTFAMTIIGDSILLSFVQTFAMDPLGEIHLKSSICNAALLTLLCAPQLYTLQKTTLNCFNPEIA